MKKKRFLMSTTLAFLVLIMWSISAKPRASAKVTYAASPWLQLAHPVMTPTPAQPSRSLPTVSDPTSSPSSVVSLFAPSDFNNMIDIPDPSLARAVAKEAVSKVDEKTQLIERNQSTINNLKKKSKELDAELDRLRREREQVLAELRSGFYCSKCMKSKTEIEQGGENFEAHLQRVAGTLVSASPEQIAAKAQEYDSKIANLVKRIESEKKRFAATTKERENENRTAWDQIQDNINLWRMAVSLEQGLIVAREKAVRKLELEEIAAANKKIRELESGDRIGSPEAIAGVNSELALWKKIKAQAEGNAEKRFSSYWRDINQSNKDRNSESGKMHGFLPRTSEYSQWMLSNYYAYGSLPSFEISAEPLKRIEPALYKALGAIPISFGFKEGMISMKGNLKVPIIGTVASMNVEAGRASPSSFETRAFLELFSTFKIGMKYIDEYTLDGSIRSQDIILETKSSKPRTEEGKSVSAETPKRVLPTLGDKP